MSGSRELHPGRKTSPTSGRTRTARSARQDKQTNRRKSAVRSIVEHPFLTLKRLWGFAKVRYRGLARNANRAYAMLALINVSKWGRPFDRTGASCVSRRIGNFPIRRPNYAL